MCRFYGTRQGCKFGESCKMRHGDAKPAGDDLRVASRSVAAEQDLAARVLLGGSSRKASFSGDGYRLRVASKAVILVGEGDFSFAFALKAGADPPTVLIATSLDSREEVVGQFPDAEARIALDPSGTYIVNHDIDATALHKADMIYRLLRELVSPVLCWVFVRTTRSPCCL